MCLLAAKSCINGAWRLFLYSLLELTQVLEIFGGEGGGTSASLQENVFQETLVHSIVSNRWICMSSLLLVTTALPWPCEMKGLLGH